MKLHKIKDVVRTIIGKITKKSCNKCKHHIDGILCGNHQKYTECISSFYPKGFEPKI